MRIQALLFLLLSLTAACGGVSDAALENTIAQKINAERCKITQREDINGSKPKTLLVEITNPRPDNFDLDFEVITSRIAFYIADSTDGRTYKNIKKISVRYFLKDDTTEYNINTADIENAKKYISRATQFAKAFAGLDTATADQLRNYRYIEQDEMEFSMETPKLQRDTFGNVTLVKFLGFTPSFIERSNAPVYEVRFAIFRQNKATEAFQVLIDKRDTLVVGYSWQLQLKK